MAALSSERARKAGYFINPRQAGGIDRYAFTEGESRGTRALCVDTGGGLRFRVLPDRGLDIDQAFLHEHSLTFLSQKGVTAPTRALDRGLDWLKGFAGGLLTSCGPFGHGAPSTDVGEELGLHGPHSQTACELETVSAPDVRGEMRIVGVIRYGALYGPNLTLRRTITTRLESNRIDFHDHFRNAGNTTIPHAWLLHINFGWPLMEPGSVYCYDAAKIEPVPGHASNLERFGDAKACRRVLAPTRAHAGRMSWVAYLYPRGDRKGHATVGLVNPTRKLAVAIHYNVKQFPRCGNWQHFGQGEYVSALEPMTGGVEGRATDRQRKWLRFLRPGQSAEYRYTIEALSGSEALNLAAKSGGAQKPA